MNAVLGGEALSTDHAGAAALVLSASAPDVAIRVSALRDVLENADAIVEQGNAGFVHDTLVARLAEAEKDVASVLFAKEHHAVLEAHVTPEEVLAAAVPAVAGSHKEDYLAVVLPYLAGRFVQQHPAHADAVVEGVFWPRLLVAKADPRTRLAAFNALKGSELEKTHVWLKGISAALPHSVDDVSPAAADKVVEVVAKNMAGASSEAVDAAVAFLLAQVASAQGEPLALALLVALRLAGKLEKSRRVQFVVAVVEALKVQQSGLDGLVAASPEHAADLLDATNSSAVATSVQNAAFAKPSADKTQQHLRAALLVGALKAVHPLKDASWTWLAPTPAPVEVAYRELCFAAYRLAHAHSASPASNALAASILETLFGALVTDDALAFLASIYAAPPSTVSVELRLAALRDAAAFVEVLAAATASPKGKLVDWQVVVPSLVVALADGDKRVRAEALRALDAVRLTLSAQSGSAAKVGVVHGRDKFYGPTVTPTALKYLDAPDVTAYLDKVLASRTELTLSPTHLATLHASLLDVASPTDSPTKETRKRKAALSFRAATYLVSHVAAWQASLVARTRLLAALEGVKDRDKAAALVALVQEAVDAPAEAHAAEEHETLVEYSRLVLQPFDGAQRKWLEDAGAVDSLVAAFETQDSTGASSRPPPPSSCSSLFLNHVADLRSLACRSARSPAQGGPAPRRQVGLLDRPRRDPPRALQAPRQARRLVRRSRRVRRPRLHPRRQARRRDGHDVPQRGAQHARAAGRQGRQARAHVGRRWRSVDGEPHRAPARARRRPRVGRVCDGPGVARPPPRPVRPPRDARRAAVDGRPDRRVVPGPAHPRRARARRRERPADVGRHGRLDPDGARPRLHAVVDQPADVLAVAPPPVAARAPRPRPAHLQRHAHLHLHGRQRSAARRRLLAARGRPDARQHRPCARQGDAEDGQRPRRPPRRAARAPARLYRRGGARPAPPPHQPVHAPRRDARRQAVPVGRRHAPRRKGGQQVERGGRPAARARRALRRRDPALGVPAGRRRAAARRRPRAVVPRAGSRRRRRRRGPGRACQGQGAGARAPQLPRVCARDQAARQQGRRGAHGDRRRRRRHLAHGGRSRPARPVDRDGRLGPGRGPGRPRRGRRLRRARDRRAHVDALVRRRAPVAPRPRRPVDPAARVRPPARPPSARQAHPPRRPVGRRRRRHRQGARGPRRERRLARGRRGRQNLGRARDARRRRRLGLPRRGRRAGQDGAGACRHRRRRPPRREDSRGRLCRPHQALVRRPSAPCFFAPRVLCRI